MNATFFLLYPFHHNFSADELVTGEGLPESWAHWFTRLDEEAFKVVVDHSFSFIPPVRAVLTPELFGGSVPPSDWRNASTIEDIRRQFVKSASPDAMRTRYANRALRLTRTMARWENRTLRLADAATGAPIGSPFIVRWTDVLLFPDHVGAVLIRIDVESGRLDDIATTSRFLKKVQFRRRLSVDVPDLLLGEGARTTWSEILAELLDGLVRDETPQSEQLNRSEYSATTGVNWRLAAFVPSTYAGLDLQRVAFHVATGRGPTELANEPSLAQLERLRANNYLDLWSSWTALHHYDNLVFVAAATDERLTAEARSHLEIFEHEYLMIYLYVLALRTALDLLAGNIASTPAKTDDAREHMNELYGNLIRFNTRMWFDQIGTSPIGPPLFRLLSDCLGLRAQHEQVFSDAQRLSDHLDARTEAYQTRIAERTEGLLQFLSLIAIPLGVYITILQPTLFKADVISDLSSDDAWYGFAALAAVTTVAWVALRWFQGDDDDEL